VAHKVLIIEDDRDLRRGLNIRLRSAGFETVLAEDGVTATMAARRECPDVILLDLGLPAGDGFVLMERFQLLSAVAATPVVVLSGRDPAVAEPRCRALGAFAFLQKPADDAVLLDTLTAAAAGQPAPI
jgi:DNA-binding response OmpR family regulator